MILSDSPEQEQLSWFMSRISSDCWSAGWAIGLEKSLWKFMHGEPLGKYPPLMEEGVRNQLRAYHEAAGGWVVWDSERKPLAGTRFITGDELQSWVDNL
jgi:hypothetical protein